MRHWRAATALAAVAAACAGGKPAPSAPYFPLVPGARWEYEVTSGSIRAELVVQAIGEREIPGWPTRIFVMLETWDAESPFEASGPVGYVVDEPYLARITAIGFDRQRELRLLGRHRPIWVLPLHPSEGQRWVQETGIFGGPEDEGRTQMWEAVVRRPEAIHLAAGAFRDVIEVETRRLDHNGTDRVHYRETYARGVGLVAIRVSAAEGEGGLLFEQRLIRYEIPGR